MSFIVESSTSLFSNGFFSSLAGGFFSVFSRHLSVELLKAFSKVYFDVGVALYWLLSAFFFFFLILGGDGLYQWKPRNNEVLIAWVLSVSEHLLHWEFSCSAERFVCMLAVLLYIQQMWGFGNEAVGIWGSYFYYWRDLRMVLLGLCNHNATGLCCIQVSSPVLELCCWG